MLFRSYIGRIEIYDDFSTLDLPDTMPDDLLHHLKSVWVAGQQLRITREGEPPAVEKVPSKKARAPVSEEHVPPVDKPQRKRPPEHHEEQQEPTEHKIERAPARGSVGMQAYRIEVGSKHGVKPANIVGAIANEAGIEAKYIGRIEIHDDYSTLDLPQGMPKELFKRLKSVWVSGQQLHMSLLGKAPPEEAAGVEKKFALSAPKKGGDRRVSEKERAARAPAKTHAGSGKHAAGGAKPKPHRKG